MATDHPHLQMIAVQLVDILAPRRNYRFKREVQVEECGGDLDVSINVVRIHPKFLTGGDPIASIEHVIDVCIEFDKMYASKTRRMKANARFQFRSALKNLQRIEPDRWQRIVEQELGIGGEEFLELQEIIQ
jgi:hypothetical protein